MRRLCTALPVVVQRNFTWGALYRKAHAPLPDGGLNPIFTMIVIIMMHWDQSATGTKQYFQGPLLLAILTATHSHSLKTCLFGRLFFLEIHDGIGGRLRRYRCTNRLTLHEA